MPIYACCKLQLGGGCGDHVSIGACKDYYVAVPHHVMPYHSGGTATILVAIMGAASPQNFWWTQRNVNDALVSAFTGP